MIVRTNLNYKVVEAAYDATYAILEKVVKWTITGDVLTIFYNDEAFNVTTSVKDAHLLHKIATIQLRNRLLRIFAVDSKRNMIRIALEGSKASLQMSNPENHIIKFVCDFENIKFEQSELNIKSTDLNALSNAIESVLISLTKKCEKSNG